MNRIAIGMLAGLAATGPMTVFMRALHAQLPARERYPLPPEEITAKAARQAGVAARPHAPGWEAKTYISHFAYGAVSGAVYAGLQSRRLDRSPLRNGVAFGLAVWALSYLGWLPATGILRPATEEPVRRNALMLGAHMVWGAATVLLSRWISVRARS